MEFIYKELIICNISLAGVLLCLNFAL